MSDTATIGTDSSSDELPESLVNLSRAMSSSLRYRAQGSDEDWIQVSRLMSELRLNCTYDTVLQVAGQSKDRHNRPRFDVKLQGSLYMIRACRRKDYQQRSLRRTQRHSRAACNQRPERGPRATGSASSNAHELSSQSSSLGIHQAADGYSNLLHAETARSGGAATAAQATESISEDYIAEQLAYIFAQEPEMETSPRPSREGGSSPTAASPVTRSTAVVPPPVLWRLCMVTKNFNGMEYGLEYLTINAGDSLLVRDGLEQDWAFGSAWKDVGYFPPSFLDDESSSAGPGPRTTEAQPRQSSHTVPRSPVPWKAHVVAEDWDGSTAGSNYLSLRRGETIMVRAGTVEGWAVGARVTQGGWFPPHYSI
jgi:hypothetical protein